MTKKICGNGAFGIIWKIVRIRDNIRIYVLLQKGPTRKFWEMTGGGLEYNTDGEYPEDEGHIFEGALCREAKEELGITLDRTKLEPEGVFQQLKRVDSDTYTTGCVLLYSHFFSEQDADSLVIVPQKTEVAETRWWDILEAITTPDTEVDYVGLPFRRMLIAFYNRHRHILKRISPTIHSSGNIAPWQGNLGQSITVDVGLDEPITV